MLEISTDQSFGVLSPAFKGCESGFALQEYAKNGCTFLNKKKCELYNTEYQPLECRFCHHERTGLGIKCHNELEDQWNSIKGRKLIKHWIHCVEFKE